MKKRQQLSVQFPLFVYVELPEWVQQSIRDKLIEYKYYKMVEVLNLAVAKHEVDVHNHKAEMELFNMREVGS